MSTLLNIDAVSIQLSGDLIVDRLNLSLEPGDIGCLLGPSGCGKTTLLRAIAGFIPVSNGKVELHGKTVSSSQVQIPTEQRAVGMMFQDFSLFPHLTVADNIRLALIDYPKNSRKSELKSYSPALVLTVIKIATRTSYPEGSNNVLLWPALWLRNLN
jgi:ABC-type spermidine/putrescine transport systems, ATPase components